MIKKIFDTQKCAFLNFEILNQSRNTKKKISLWIFLQKPKLSFSGVKKNFKLNNKKKIGFCSLM